jgi:hypothetical protein
MTIRGKVIPLSTVTRASQQLDLAQPALRRALQPTIVETHRIALVKERTRRAIGHLERVVVDHHHAERHPVEQRPGCRQLVASALKGPVHRMLMMPRKVVILGKCE